LNVKITVIKKCLFSDLGSNYLKNEKDIEECKILELGNEFIYTGNAVMPEGFCS